MALEQPRAAVGEAPVRVMTCLSAPMPRRWSRACSSEGLRIVAAVSSVEEAVEELRTRNTPDVVLAQPALLSTPAAIEGLRSGGPERVPVLLWGEPHQHWDVIDALRYGASGYVHSNAALHEVGAAVRSAAAGALVVSREDVVHVVKHLLGLEPTTPPVR
jgi:DNA-binding NarL/FixJ family response regulator